MTALAAPIAGRLRRPSWKDTRLVVGLLLVLLATALGAAGLRAADHRVPVLAACALTVQVIDGGPLLVWSSEFYIDALNVFLVALTAFVGLTTAIFSRPYMRIERDRGPAGRWLCAA